MIEPEIPDCEATRLDTLVGLNILDTPAEERFDRLTRVSRHLFGTSMAMVSLVDRDRQWFKSCIGVTVRETPRAISFCGHAILNDEVMVVPDALKDARFVDNPLVCGEPNVRFYIGCPIRATNGMRIGVLCLVDTSPRSGVSAQEIEALRDLALLVEREIALVHMATEDELTGLSNRRGFALHAEKCLNVCRRRDLPASLVFVDINKFKQINDTHGHAEGDRALVDFADGMRTAFRTSDHTVRLGGDEFAALLVDSNREVAMDAVKRLSEVVNRPSRAGERDYDIHFSYGVVEYDPQRHISVQALLAEGDTLMYLHKAAYD
ncbi:MAG: sensor domain-containing diguanylate cyclase [Halioglobus sp.]|nr:sensor domain-containing diguanylate cyclase [Halioglobus sp.]